MENKDRYISLLREVKRDGIEDLISYLESTDFFTCPASTKYHGDFTGGLCQHSLNVYDNLVKLNEMYNLHLDEDSMKLSALLHDVSKTNFYEEYFQNKKLYTPNGSKWDDGGRYDWVSVKSYRIKEPELRYVARDHEFDSYMKIKDYVKLTDEEIVAIVNHHAGMGESIPVRDLNQIFDRYTLASALHLADMISVYFIENKHEKNN